MPDATYWRRRFQQLEAARHAVSADLLRDVEALYRQAEKEIEARIAVWYQRFASNNGITLADARKWMTGKDLQELKWDVSEYIQHGEEHALLGNWGKELENASAKFHISRLEALRIHTRQSLELLFARQTEALQKGLGGLYRSGYYHTAFELQMGFGIGWDIAGIDQRQLDKVLAKPWAADGYNFSERIWRDKQKLVSELHAQLTQNLLLGRDPKYAIDAISKKLNASKSNAGRLVMTESAYFSALGQGDGFHDLDVEWYEIVATLDSRTSELCRDMDGRVFPLTAYEPGVTAPPFHPWCRTTTVPWFEDDFGSVGQRAARGADGKVYYVPANMTYREWEKAFVKGGSKDDLTPSTTLQTTSGSGTIATADKAFLSVVGGLPTSPQGYEDTLKNAFASGKQVAREAFAKHVKPGSVADGRYSGTAYFDPATCRVKMNFARDMTDKRGITTCFFHEHGHYIDYVSCPKSGHTSLVTPDFGTALRKDFDDYIEAIKKANGLKKKTEAYAVVSRELMTQKHNGISDLFGGMSKNRAVGLYGHKPGYWKGYGVLEQEAFAHMFVAMFDTDRYALMQKYFPTALAEFEKLLKGLI